MCKAGLKLLGVCVIVLVGCSTNAAPATETPLPPIAPEIKSPTLTPEALPSTETPMPALAIFNGSIIDGTGADPIPNGVIVIKDGMITEIGTGGEVEIPDNAELIDARGGTILPGLVDAHVHRVDDLLAAEGELSSTRVKGNLSKGLKAGITTFLDLGSPWGVIRNVGVLRDALSDAGNQVPNVAIAGPIISVPDSSISRFAPSKTLEIVNIEEAQTITKDLIAQGVDLIKIYIGSVSRTPLDGKLTRPSLTAEQIQTIVQSAHEEGVMVIAHAVDEEAAFLATANGVDAFAHWPGKNGDPLP
ncbi:MAG: amidohydrolase family protein, partial [Chloroflexota bacterium]